MNLREVDKKMQIDQQEWLILQVTIHIEKLMEEKNVSKAELARRLGTSNSYVTQLIDGTTNMTLKKIADVMLALDSSLLVDTCPLGFQTTVQPKLNEVCRTPQSDWESMADEEQVREAELEKVA